MCIYCETIMTISLVNICHYTELQNVFLSTWDPWLFLVAIHIGALVSCPEHTSKLATQALSVVSPCFNSFHSTYQCYIDLCKYFFLIFIYLFIYLWLCWVFVSVRGLSPVAASGGHSSSRCTDLSLSRPLIAEHRLQTRRLSNCGSRA